MVEPTFVIGDPFKKSIWSIETNEFMPLATIVNPLEKIGSLIIPMLKSNIKNSLIQRVMVCFCDKLEIIEEFIIEKCKISSLKRMSFKGKTCLCIGWYNIKHITGDILLVNEYSSKKKANISWSDVNNGSWLKILIKTPNFKFMEDHYDTIYLFFMKTVKNIVSFQNEVCTQLCKFSDVMKLEIIGWNCFKCRFFDIRVPFILKKMGNLTVNGNSIFVYLTLIEAHEAISAQLYTKISQIDKFSVTSCDSSSVYFELLNQINDYESPQDEWKKYMQLKHRRLSTLPFTICNIPSENVISLNKIISGEEKRVTLMIRNIPNVLNHLQLKEFVDFTSFGDYDFICMIFYFFILILGNY